MIINTTRTAPGHERTHRRKSLAKFNLAFLDIHHIFRTVGYVGLDHSSLIKNEASSRSIDDLHPAAKDTG